jgi:hypothetical protein
VATFQLSIYEGYFSGENIFWRKFRAKLKMSNKPNVEIIVDNDDWMSFQIPHKFLFFCPTSYFDIMPIRFGTYIDSSNNMSKDSPWMSRVCKISSESKEKTISKKALKKIVRQKNGLQVRATAEKTYLPKEYI